MKLSLTDLSAGISAVLISLASTAATLVLLTLGAAGAYKVAAGHTRVQNPRDARSSPSRSSAPPSPPRCRSTV